VKIKKYTSFLLTFKDEGRFARKAGYDYLFKEIRRHHEKEET
jgi:hypothetical protein